MKVLIRFGLALTVFGWISSAQALLITAEASLDGAQQNPPVTTAASGSATVIFDTTSNTLDLSLIVTGIFLADITFPGDGGLAFGGIGPVHIHQGVVGVNGMVVVPFPNQADYSETGDGFQLIATGAAFDPAIVSDLLDQGLYLNVHTLASPSGEIRGQLIPTSVVPVPATIGLCSLGLLLLAGLRRR